VVAPHAPEVEAAIALCNKRMELTGVDLYKVRPAGHCPQRQ
jgi:hypothetical protein